MKQAFLGTSLILLTACQSTTPQVKMENISIPNIDIVSQASLGDRMLMQAKGFTANSVTVSSGEGINTSMSGGKYCERVKGSNKYYSDDPQAIGLKNGYGNVISFTNYVTYNKKLNKVCAAPMSCYDETEVSIEFKENDRCLVENSLQQIIEYNGRNGEILNFTYREFSDKMMRNSFTTNFTVDLSQGNIVTYKGSQIEVKNATNSKIEYKVLKNFNSYL